MKEGTVIINIESKGLANQIEEARYKLDNFIAGLEKPSIKSGLVQDCKMESKYGNTLIYRVFLRKKIDENELRWL
jgi:hypothetical protein